MRGRPVRFEWDENKRRTNIDKHGIDFRDARVVFFDEWRVDEFDEGHSDYGDRWWTVGMSRNDVLFVVYAERCDDVIRIISARKANRHEQELYYANRGH